MSKKIIAGIEIVVAIIMWLVVTKISPVCGGMLELASGKQVHMKCYYTAVVFVFIAVALLINGILSLFVKASVASGIMTVVLAVLVFATLNDSVGIGICANPEMACQMTAPIVKVCAAVEVLCGTIYAVFASKEK